MIYSNKKGNSTIIFLLILALGIYLGVSFGNPYFKESLLQDFIKTTINSSNSDFSFQKLTIPEIRKRILNYVKEHNIPISDDQLKVYQKGNNTVVVYYSYIENVNIKLINKQYPIKFTRELSYNY